VVTKHDPEQERLAAAEHRALADLREAEPDLVADRNARWWHLYHDLGYSQRSIAAMANQGLPPGSRQRVTEDAVEKALTRMAEQMVAS